MQVELEEKIYEFDKPMTIGRIFEHLDLNRESYLAVVDNVLVTDDYRVNGNDKVKLIRVISGG